MTIRKPRMASSGAFLKSSNYMEKEYIKGSNKEKGGKVVNISRDSDEARNEFHLVEEYLSRHYEFKHNSVLDLTQYRSLSNPDQAFKDLNEKQIYVDLQKAGVKISQAKLNAILESDFIPTYDPIKDYFESLRFDKRKGSSIDKLLSLIKVKDQNRFNTNLKKMLVRSIACAREEGVVNKQMLVLISEKQNTGKSTLIRWLCPPSLKDYYTENVDFHDKDTLIACTENFMINIDELAALWKPEINKLKAIVSKEHDKSRRAYGTRQIRRMRRANFFGSTNDLEFLRDHTGNIRWICFIIERIDFSYKQKVNINDVWAEAYDLYKGGFDYQLTRNELDENEEANKEFMVVTPEMEMIQEYFLPGDKSDNDRFLTATNFGTVFQHVIRGARIDSTHIGKTLKFLGFRKSSMYRADKVYSQKGYYIKYKFKNGNSKAKNTIEEHDIGFTLKSDI